MGRVRQKLEAVIAHREAKWVTDGGRGIGLPFLGTPSDILRIVWPITSAINVTSPGWNLRKESGEFPAPKSLFSWSALRVGGVFGYPAVSRKWAGTPSTLWFEKYMPEEKKRGWLFLLALVSVNTGRYSAMWTYLFPWDCKFSKKGPGVSPCIPNSCKHSAQQTRGWIGCLFNEWLSHKLPCGLMLSTLYVWVPLELWMSHLSQVIGAF